MKALMFGWEFPPHILGGLGTASFGLTRGMAMQPDMDITFCIPKPGAMKTELSKDSGCQPSSDCLEGC